MSRLFVYALLALETKMTERAEDSKAKAAECEARPAAGNQLEMNEARSERAQYLAAFDEACRCRALVKDLREAIEHDLR